MRALSFVAGAALSWRVYVPVVHLAAFENSNLRAFMFVGAAYFVVAVLIPAFFIFVAKSDPTVRHGTVPNFHLHASFWGLAAGSHTGEYYRLPILRPLNFTAPSSIDERGKHRGAYWALPEHVAGRSQAQGASGTHLYHAFVIGRHGDGGGLGQ